MKLIVTLALSIVCCSCFQATRDAGNIRQMEERITTLEQRLDALTGQTTGSTSSINTFTSGTSGSSHSSGSSTYSGRCQATTKKGSQCSRKAKGGGYCWQHGG